MKRWRSKLVLLGGAAAILGAIPALSQETPESLLPPGFGDPAPPPPARDPGAPRPEVSGPALAPAPRTPSPPSVQSVPAGETPTIEELEKLLAELPPPIEIPEGSRRPVDVAGPLGPEGWALAPDAFGTANGRFLSTLMRRLDAPIPSRWMHIVLRRALLSRVPAPSFVHPVDWIAERAWLLLRMGEADGARMLVQGVDVDRFTPKMFTIAVQTALATADPAALCPLVEPGRKTSDEPVWPLAEAMCSALAGEASQASLLIDQARRRGRVGGIDVTLAEKIVGAGENTRRAVSVQWDEVDEINSWRFGLASATGLQIPDRLMNGAGAHVRAWQARSPMLPIEQRVASAEAAASLGVFSSASLVELYSLIADETDPGDFADSVGGRLRRAYVARDVGDRMAAMRALWGDGAGSVAQHARRILTATAATRIAPSEQLQGDAVDLIASMLSAGYDAQAARWSEVVAGMDGAEGHRAWSMLAVASPQPRVEISAGRIEAFRDADDSAGDFRSKLLVAALAGLGRIDGDTAAGLAQDMEFNLGRENRWTRMLERAVQRRQPGTVALLAGIGMQTADWRGVPPEHLYRILSALRRVGLGYEARLIAAEAMARL
jgi:hypothetical protein